MTTFVLIHGAGDTGWAWHLLEDELRARGHQTIAPPLPSADDAMGRGQEQSETPMRGPWPRRDWPEIPTRFIAFSDDRFFPVEFLRRVMVDRLGIVPEEVPGGHCMMLAEPRVLADALLVGTE